MDDRVKKLENIKKEVKTPELKKAISDKIDKIKNSSKIYKDGN